MRNFEAHLVVRFGLLLLLVGCTGAAPLPIAGDDEVAVIAAPLSASDCPAGYTIIRGTTAADTLIGSSANDCIVGLGGNDVIYGRGGNDFLIGGAGDDKLYGEEGTDRLYGEGGVDRIEGGAGEDSAHGGSGNDTIYGGAGNDTLDGEANNDVVYGDDGDDILDGGSHTDQVWGGLGDDVIYGNEGNDTLHGDDGDDAIIGGAGTNVVNGGLGTDACSGTACEKPQLALSGCTLDSQCGANRRCVAEIGLCLGCVADQDGDFTCDSKDGCPSDPGKVSTGSCGCGVADLDSDMDGTPDCSDQCPEDGQKITAGVCGCNISDVDSDGDLAPDCMDVCNGHHDIIDADADGMPDGCDPCPDDVDNDSDGDGSCDSQDTCLSGADGMDADGDGVCDAEDLCAAADDTRDEDQDGVVDHCEILRPVAMVGARSTYSKPEDSNLDGRPDLRGGYRYLNQGNFRFTTDYAISNRCTDARPADLDGDGFVDGMGNDSGSGAMNGSGYGYYLCYGTASGNLLPHTLIEEGITGSFTMADVTGDGVPDIVGVDESALIIAEVLAAPQRGVGRVQRIPGDRSDFVVSEFGFTDLDHNGSTEIVLRVWDGETRVYERDAGGDFALTATGQTRHIWMKVADLDGDGLFDILTGSRSDHSDGAGMLVYRGLPPGTPGQPGAFGNARFMFDAGVFLPELPGANDFRAIDVTELTGNAASEILFTGGAGLYVASYRPGMPLRWLQFLPGEAEYNGFVHGADFDGDGDLDVDQPLSDTTRVLANVACRAGAQPDTDQDGIADACDACAGPYVDSDQDDVCDAADVCAGHDDHDDADRDGVADGCDPCPNDAGDDSDADGSCDSDDPCPLGDDALDADGDGHCDAHDICPNGADEDAGYPLECSVLFETAATIEGLGFASLVSGDLDGDGNGDLVGVSSTQLAQWRGLGDGNFELFEPALEQDNYYGPAPVLRDLDGDGFLDALLSLGSWPQLVVAYGDGTGHLELGQSLGDAGDVAVADITGDHIADVIVTTQQAVVVWAGGAARNSLQAVVPTPDMQFYSVVAGDFDGDDRAEVIGLGPSGIGIVALGSGGALHGEWLEESYESDYWLNETQLAAVDIDRDGADELLVLRTGADWMNNSYAEVTAYGAVTAAEYQRSFWGMFTGSTILLNGVGQISTWGQSASDMLVANVTGDQRPEVLLRTSEGLAIYGLFTFEEPWWYRSQLIANAPWNVTLVDLDGDDRVELLGSKTDGSGFVAYRRPQP